MRLFSVAPPAVPRPYDILPDGRFVAVEAVSQLDQVPNQMVVVLNWFEELRRRVPVGN
jgi:hypothetical protein